MSTFKEAYIDLVKMVDEAKASTSLSEESLLDLFKTQLVYGQPPITNTVEFTGEQITGDETDFSEDTNDDEDPDDDLPVIPFAN
jgi:hypothetical protein